MIQTNIEQKEIRLYDAIRQINSSIDICDNDWDWGINFWCEKEWDVCEDYYDRLMLLFGLNIKCLKVVNDWYSPCLVKEFIMENIDIFRSFFNENNRKGYRPMDYENSDDGNVDEGFFEAYMEPMESLIAGNYSEEDYKELFEELTKEVK